MLGWSGPSAASNSSSADTEDRRRGPGGDPVHKTERGREACECGDHGECNGGI